jgi:hypothetical protein
VQAGEDLRELGDVPGEGVKVRAAFPRLRELGFSSSSRFSGSVRVPAGQVAGFRARRPRPAARPAPSLPPARPGSPSRTAAGPQPAPRPAGTPPGLTPPVRPAWAARAAPRYRARQSPPSVSAAARADGQAFAGAAGRPPRPHRLVHRDRHHRRRPHADRAVPAGHDPSGLQAAPARQLAAAYHERWEMENGYGELKSRLRRAEFTLRSRTLDLACQELYAFLVIYQALCGAAG